MRICGWNRILTRYSTDFGFVLGNCNICLKDFFIILSKTMFCTNHFQILQGRPYVISLVPDFTYFSFSVSVFMENCVSADEDENPNAHGEGPEHLHPLRVTMLFQKP